MDNQTFLLALVFGIFLCGVLGAAVSHSSSRGIGFVLGALLGPIGILIAAVLGNRAASAVPVHVHAPPPAHTYTAPTLSAALPDLPDTFQIRRGYGTTAEEFGPYSLEEVMDYLAAGTLLPTDHYRTPAGHWALLGKTGLHL